MKQFLSRMPAAPTSIFAVMTKMANDHEAVNLSQGFPDFQCDPELIELVRKYMLEGKNQYAPMPGVLPLKEKLAGKMEASYGVRINPDTEITITSGATQALFTILTTFVLPGDEIIIFEPAYDSYKPTIEAMGGVAIPIALNPPDFQIEWEKFQSALSPRTKMVIINTPHNPCGTILQAETVRRLVDCSNEHGFLLLSDEVYEHIVFDGNLHNSVLSSYDKCPNLIAVFSFGKTFHATGWKVGYIVANARITAEIRKIHQFTVFAVNTPVQYAYAEFLEDSQHYLSLPAFYQEKRDRFLSYMQGSVYGITPSQGTYFQLLEYSAISNLPDTQFAELLVKEFKIAAIPLSPFCSTPSPHHLIRICFAKNDTTLSVGAERLLQAAEQLRNH